MDRFICTEQEHWTTQKFASHPDAIYVRDKDYGDGDNVAIYKCPHCGLEFKEALAQ